MAEELRSDLEGGQARTPEVLGKGVGAPAGARGPAVAATGPTGGTGPTGPKLSQEKIQAAVEGARLQVMKLQELLAQGFEKLSGAKILNLKPTDVVVFTGEITPELWQAISASWEQFWATRGILAPALWHVPPTMDLRALDEGQMRALGWVRSGLIVPK